jgi:predicted nucleic acid-binding protein
VTGRVLPFDEAAAGVHADVRAMAARTGTAIGDSDGYVAATARANDLTVATRDTAPFLAGGAKAINPWEATPGR